MQQTGRGGLAVLGAKVFFLLTGFLQQVLLPRSIGLAGYGTLSRVLAFGNVFTNLVILSCLQGVSRLVASSPGKEQQTFRAALRIHLPLACGLGIAFACAAPAFARFEKALDIVPPLIAMGGVVCLYGLYAPLVGFLNGTQRFVQQAVLDIAFSTFRTLGMVGMGWLFARLHYPGPLGVVLGFLLAVLLILPLAVRASMLLQPQKKEETVAFHTRAYGAFLLSLGSVHFCTYALMQTDLLLVGRFLSHQANLLYPTAAVASRMADEWVAVYRACQLFSFLPYQLLMSLTHVLFPLLAAAKAQDNTSNVRLYMQRGARLGALGTGLMVTLIAGLAHPLLAMTYGAHVAERGAPVLRVLALGQGAFAMIGIAMTMLTSLGRERLSALLGCVVFALLVLSCNGFLAHAPFGEAQLHAAARAVLVSLGAGLCLASALLWKLFGSFVPWRSALRSGGSVACSLWVASFFPTCSALGVIVWGGILASTFLGILLLTGELSWVDMHAVHRLIKRKN